ncbi:MAG: zinc ABC transporter substrate-binding protein [Candidatus Delongbacteria bacterium]|nr:zinc ABC transporter substrate-binding protein [Candidatus Delongbacteria bacterium]
MRSLIYLVLGCLFFVTGAVCRSSNSDKSTPRPVITVSILPLKYLTRRITGDRFDINVMVPPGDNVESYEPVASQMKDLSRSSLYLMIGYLPFELSQRDRFQDLNPEMSMVNLSAGVDLITGSHHHSHSSQSHSDHEDGEGTVGIDPHIWLSPVSVRSMIKTIRDAVIRLDTAQADFYRHRYDSLQQDVDRVDSLFQSVFQSSANRCFMVFHPAWSYPARDYQLEQVAMEVEGKSPSPADIRRLIDLGRRRRIRVIFIQKQFDTADAHTIADEIGAEIVVLDPVAEDWLVSMEQTAAALQKALSDHE